jgi:hypothetical protein
MTEKVPYVPSHLQLVSEIFVRNVLVSKEFYVGLGFIFERESEGFVCLSWENHLLFLEERKELANVSLPPFPAANVRIMVPDVDSYWKKIVVEGINPPKVLAKIEDRYYGLRDFTITDPDGYGIRYGTFLTGAQKE